MASFMTVSGRVQQRHDNKLSWETVNPILLPGEMGVETDGNKFKIGDGNTRWNDLPYAGGEGSVDTVVLQRTIHGGTPGTVFNEDGLSEPIGPIKTLMDYIDAQIDAKLDDATIHGGTP